MEGKTIWRVTEDDFRVFMEEKGLTEQQMEAILESAHRNFSIEDWADHVEIFIDLHL